MWALPEAEEGREQAYRGVVGGEFLEVHRGGGEAGLDVYVGQPAAHGAAQAVVTFCAAVGAFDVPAVASVEFAGGFVPAALVFASSA